MSRISRKRDWAVALTLVAAIVVGACSEQTKEGAACPILCPAQNVSVFDTVFEAVAIDTTIPGFPPFGTEPTLPLINRGDTVDTRAVVRFDSLLHFFSTTSGDSLVTAIDSPFVVLHIDRANSSFTGPVTIQVFNVDTVENDTTVTPELQLFRPDRLIGGITLDSAQITDTLFVPLDSTLFSAVITAGTRLRLGLQATSAAPVQLGILSSEGGNAPTVRYRATADTSVKPVLTAPNTPRPLPIVLSSDYRDYELVFRTPPIPAGLDAVSGVPGRRVYMSFNVPAHILDSSTVLRATLLLTQYPSREVDPTVPLIVYPQLVVAGNEVTDIARSALLLGTAGFGFDSVRVMPGDSGVVEVEIVNALRTWSLPFSKGTQQAMVLRTAVEAIQPRRFLFFSTKAAAAVRPRLRVNYSPRARFGIP